MEKKEKGSKWLNSSMWRIQTKFSSLFIRLSLSLSHLVDSGHDSKNGSIWNDGGLDAVSRQTGGHLMTLRTTRTHTSSAHSPTLHLQGIVGNVTWQNGAHSATMTWNLRLRAASFRKASTVRERPIVMITSLEWMCSRACIAMLSVVPSAHRHTHHEQIYSISY